MEVVQVTRSFKIYIASDGTEFTTEHRCLCYEAQRAYVDSIIKDASACDSSYKIIKVDTEEQWSKVCRYFVYEFDNEEYYDFENEHKDYIGKYLVAEYNDELTSIKPVEDWLKDKQIEIDVLVKKMNAVSMYKNE
jgi:hypothetical protein